MGKIEDLWNLNIEKGSFLAAKDWRWTLEVMIVDKGKMEMEMENNALGF